MRSPSVSRATGRGTAVLALLVAGWLLAPASATAKPGVVVLAFGGPGGDTARAVVARLIQGRYQVIAGARLLAACDDLGITFGKGKNLARAAAHVRAVAVVGGKVIGRRLTFAVFSGRSGRPSLSSSVPWARRPPKKSVARLRAILMPALAREARRGPGSSSGTSGGGKHLTFAPDPVRKSSDDGSSAGTGSLKFEPDHVDRSGEDASATAGAGVAEESPPDLRYTPDGAATDTRADASTAGLQFGPAGEVRGAPEPAAVKPARDEARPPRAMAQLGLGIWMRDFSLNQPADNQTHSEYRSGAAFALQLALRAHPLAFLPGEGFTRDIFLRFSLQSSLGLSSRTDPASDEGFGTSMTEVIFDAGYHWNILSKPASPTVELGVGGGSTGFSVDWGSQQPQISATSYPFLLFGLGAQYPFVRALAWADPGSALENLTASLRFDYRVVFGSGELSDDEWYGDSSQGGLCLSLGFDWRHKGFVARVAYTYTRYFLSFDSAAYASRVANDKLAAGGALDQFNGFTFAGGYSF